MILMIAGEALGAEPALAPVTELSSDGDVADEAYLASINNGELDMELPSDSGGYYPTIDETMLLGGDYPRLGNGNSPPDVLMQREQGLYPYPHPGQGYRAPWGESLSPLNPYLGFFAPREALIHDNGSNNPLGFGYFADASFPLLVRDFSPERAMVKAGPAYFDLLYIGMTLLHSDYQGPAAFDKGSEDGWLMGVEFGLRGLVQFTDQFYLSLVGTVTYLPLDNKLGFSLGSGGSPSAAAGLDYQFEYKNWDVRLYDTFVAGLGYDVFIGADSDAHQQAGRYSFGFNDSGRSNDYYDGDNTYFTNSIGFDASTPVWQDWRFWLSGQHADTWRTWDFEDHEGRNSLSALLGYNGSELRFAPSVQYNLDHTQGAGIVDHRVYLALRGRISENINLVARAGYLWTSGDSSYGDSYLYSLSLTHQLTRNTSHSLSAGRDYFNNSLTGDTTVASYVSYDINHTFTRSLQGAAGIQYSDEDGDTFNGERTNISSSLTYSFFNGYNSAISIRGAYELREASNSVDNDRWLGMINYSQQLFTRVTGNIFYQYEETSGDDGFNEQLFGCSVRKYF